MRNDTQASDSSLMGKLQEERKEIERHRDELRTREKEEKTERGNREKDEGITS